MSTQIIENNNCEGEEQNEEMKLILNDIAASEGQTTNNATTELKTPNLKELSEEPEFYIEVDVGSVANLRAGTHYTLVPLNNNGDVMEEKKPKVDETEPKVLSVTECPSGKGNIYKTIERDLSTGTEALIPVSMHNGSGDMKEDFIDHPVLINLDDDPEAFPKEYTLLGQAQVHEPVMTTPSHPGQIPTPRPVPSAFGAVHPNMHGHFGYPVGNGVYMIPTPIPHGQVGGRWPRHHNSNWAHCPPQMPLIPPGLIPINHPPHHPANNNTSLVKEVNKENKDPNSSPSTSSNSSEIRGSNNCEGPVVLEYPPGPSNGNNNNNDSSSTAAAVNRMPLTMNAANIVGPLDNCQYYVPYSDQSDRETHNEKERMRRSRIKSSCQTFRAIVPGISDKTDKATVFEFAVQYVLHIKRKIGVQFDRDFVERYSPY